MITLGGNAELELVDSLDPFSEGIVFSVMPPKKSWKNIANLSGGEKVRYRSYQSNRSEKVTVIDIIFTISTDTQFSCPRICTSSFQTNPTLRNG
jgi:hypothetical protein